MEGESQEVILTAKHLQLCRRSKIIHAYCAQRDFVHRAVGLACIHHPTGIANSQSLEPATKVRRFAPYDKRSRLHARALRDCRVGVREKSGHAMAQAYWPGGVA